MERIRWSIFHEIGHCYLGHHDHPDDTLAEQEEAEANFFAKYIIAPPPLINLAGCACVEDVQTTFELSRQAAEYTWEYYQKWYNYPMITASEHDIISMFSN